MDVLRVFFASGWAFFLPYALIYALGFALEWTNATVRLLFWVCHLAVGAVFLAFALDALKARYRGLLNLLKDPGPWFWVLLGLFFFLPGAYLEFPADPWEHFRRLHTFDPGGALRHAPWVHRFSYFWGWTFFSLCPLVHQRLLADGYSAFWQLLLAYQFYRFGFRLSGSRPWARIHVVGAIALFGNNAFSFFRYYALGSTMLAYIAYLAAAGALVDLLEGRVQARRAVPTLLTAACLAYFDHIQEFLLLVLFSGAATCAFVWMRLSARARSVLASTALATFAISVLVARRALAHPAAFHLTPGRFYYPWMSSFGAYRLWDPVLTYFTTMGLHGILAVLLAAVLWRSRLLIAALTLTPIVVLVFPLFTLPLAEFGPRVLLTYRVLFLVPSSVILVTAFQEVSRRIGAARARADRILQAAAVGFILILGFYERAPVFGKLRFMLYRPPALLEARYVDETAAWFAAHRTRSPWCTIASDEVTEFVLGAYFGAPLRFERATGATYPGYGWSGRNVLELIDQAAAYSPCGFLVPQVNADPWRRLRSHYGPLSRHWGREGADPVARTPLGLRENAPLLVERGWTRTFVPPFYAYYEPPAHGRWR